VKSLGSDVGLTERGNQTFNLDFVVPLTPGQSLKKGGLGDRTKHATDPVTLSSRQRLIAYRSLGPTNPAKRRKASLVVPSQWIS
jgi:hypothetical protein